MTSPEQVAAEAIAEKFNPQSHIGYDWKGWRAAGRPEDDSAFMERPDPEDTMERRVNDGGVSVHFIAGDGYTSFRSPSPAELSAVVVAALRDAGYLIEDLTELYQNEYAAHIVYVDLVPDAWSPGTLQWCRDVARDWADNAEVRSTEVVRRRHYVGPWRPVEEESNDV